MSRGGPFSGYQDQAPHGWPTHEQIFWDRPWETGVDDYYDELEERGWLVPIFPPVSSGQALGGLEAPLATTRTPGGEPSSMPSSPRACAPLHPPA
jgi:hypothetical protein